MKTLRYLLMAALPAAILFSCAKPQETDKQKPDDQPETPATESTTLKAGAVELTSEAGTSELPFTLTNPVQGEKVTATVDENGSWLTLGQVSDNAVQISYPENLSADRGAVVTLSYKGVDDVKVPVIQRQRVWPEFGIQMSKLGPFGATFTVTRKAAYEGGYFFEILDKAAVDKYLAGEKHKMGDFDYGDAIYQSDLAYLKRLSQQHGHPLSELFGMLGSMYSKETTVTMPYSSLLPDSEYVFIVYGMEDTDEATRKTPLCFFYFKTEFSSESGLTFTGKATDVTETYATITVSPSNNTEYWYMNWASEIDLKTKTLAEVMQSSINSAKSLLNRYTAEEILCHGPESLQATDLMPGTEYSVIAWGMNPEDMTATTAPVVVFTFTTPDYSTVSDCDFDIEILKIEDMDVQVKVTPTDLDLRYYIAFVSKSIMEGYTDEQAAQRIINMEAQRIDRGEYDIPDLSWSNLPGLEAGIRTVWGRRDEGWTFVPRHDYRIYVFGISNLGIRTTKVVGKDFTTADPGASENSFQVSIVSNTWLGVDYTVTPSNDEEYWMPFFATREDIDTYCRNADGTLNEPLIYDWVEEFYEDEIKYHSYRGEKTLHQHVTPDTEYVLLIFGWAGTYTTKMYDWNLYVPQPPLGKSTADYEYSYELFRGEDLSALDPTVWPIGEVKGDCIMIVRIQPTENAAHWYFGVWPPKENYQDSGGLYYLMTLDMNPDVSAVDRKFYRTRPWWYGCGNGSADKQEPWTDSEGHHMNYYPWTISGWAEDAEGNYGPMHYDYLIPVPLPKDQVTGPYERGYDEAYNFWSAPASAPEYVFSVSTGKDIALPFRTPKYNQ